ncbi:MAG: zinc metalloprotease HtpX [Thermoplasmata archaeon]|nr:zinc metalloprotease HtpX [Thermoplasmata archaeon]
MAGRLRTAGLFLFLLALFGLIGWFLGGFFANEWYLGAAIFLGLAAVFNLIAYFGSARIVLRSYRAKVVTEKEAPKLYRSVRRVAQMADIPMPRVAVMSSPTPNAFATGRNPKNAVVAVTEGMLRLLPQEELEGVLAHELAHIKDRDILVMSVAATLAGAIAFMARFAFYGALFRQRNQGALILLLVIAITAPLAAAIVQLAISRTREFKADAVGGRTLRQPLHLARALERLDEANQRRPMQRGNPASASLFIVNPFRRRSTLVRLFSTHPPIEERVRRLRDLALEFGQYAYPTRQRG